MESELMGVRATAAAAAFSLLRCFLSAVFERGPESSSDFDAPGSASSLSSPEQASPSDASATGGIPQGNPMAPPVPIVVPLKLAKKESASDAAALGRGCGGGGGGFRCRSLSVHGAGSSDCGKSRRRSFSKPRDDSSWARSPNRRVGRGAPRGNTRAANPSARLIETTARDGETAPAKLDEIGGGGPSNHSTRA
eukprot:scaffold7714_cov25-Tisochrysis_lutea.AAC.9